jgi:ABC-type sugar transport system ATPase subunit
MAKAYIDNALWQTIDMIPGGRYCPVQAHADQGGTCWPRPTGAGGKNDGFSSGYRLPHLANDCHASASGRSTAATEGGRDEQGSTLGWVTTTVPDPGRQFQMTGPKPGAGLAVRATGISKSFGGALALDDVRLVVEPGECHAVVGENGAGKSTLMRVLAGLTAPDRGTVTCFGRSVTATAGSARAAGVALVHQERSLVPQMTVAENVCLGAAPTTFGLTNTGRQNDIAGALLERIGADVDPRSRVARLSSAQQQFVEIAKALRQEPRVLILDEPSASLTPMETDRLLGLLRGLAREGIAIVYISHRLPEVYSLCQRATVLRDGRLIGAVELRDTSPGRLVELMIGRALEHDLKVERPAHSGQVVLQVDGVTTAIVRDVSLTVHATEIVGIGGLVGSGRTEMVRAIVGLDPRRAGMVTVTGSDGRSASINTYANATRSGIGFLPEERRGEGVLIDMSIGENIMLPTRRATSWNGIARTRQRAQLVDDVIRQVGIHPATAKTLVGALSGGNQQKVAFGKWLPAEPAVLILDEPTRGVDVGAKAEIHRLIRSLADDGAAVLFVSSDLPELLALADRTLVVRDGRIVGELSRGEATEEAVMSLAAGREAEVGSDD